MDNNYFFDQESVKRSADILNYLSINAVDDVLLRNSINRLKEDIERNLYFNGNSIDTTERVSLQLAFPYMNDIWKYDFMIEEMEREVKKHVRDHISELNSHVVVQGLMYSVSGKLRNKIKGVGGDLEECIVRKKQYLDYYFVTEEIVRNSWRSHVVEVSFYVEMREK